MEYRFNFIVDAMLQPTVTAMIEMAIWYTLINSFAGHSLGGFSTNQYLLYALWAAFFARQMGTWAYDFTISSEIQMGTINAVLSRPISYYEYHLFQFLGHKSLALCLSLLVPIGLSLVIEPGFDFSRLPIAILLGVGYLVFAFTLTFFVSSLGFFMTRVNSIVLAKNIGLWILTGEIFPLDLLPDQLATIAKVLPFASGVYLPVGYLVGRVSPEQLGQGVLGLIAGTLVLGAASAVLWHGGLRRYSGVGA